MITILLFLSKLGYIFAPGGQKCGQRATKEALNIATFEFSYTIFRITILMHNIFFLTNIINA